MPTIGIQKDLRLGDIGETLVTDVFAQAGISAAKNNDTSTRSHYDLHCNIDDLSFTVEVKNDIYALRSGNIAVEFYNPKSGKPSGLFVTQATLWSFVIGTEVWVANTPDLKRFCESVKPFRIIDTAGDGNASLMLYKKDDIFSIFTQVDTLETNERLGELALLISGATSI